MRVNYPKLPFGEVITNKIFNMNKSQNRSIKDIAKDIHANWKNVYFGASPYLNAMYSLDKITDKYGQDDASSIINYFLANAQTWRGDKAREIKAELKQLLKG